MDFLNNEITIKEISALQDELHIVAYIANDKLNGNDFYIPTQILTSSYESFRGTPLRVLINPLTGRPTGHGLNKKTGEFSKDVKNVGTIKDVYLEGVNSNGEIVSYDSDDVVETRVLFEAVFWKTYFPDIADTVSDLYKEGNLHFSFEALTKTETAEDGRRIATAFRGIGIAIVENPAYKIADAIYVAEQDDDVNGGTEKVDEFETKYNETKALYDALIQDKATVDAKVVELSEKVTSLETDLAAKNTELAEKVSVVAQKETELAELQEYKTKFETAEKEKTGKERREQLKRFGEIEKTDVELAEMSDLEFSQFNLQLAIASLDEVPTRKGNFVGGAKTSGEILKEYL